MCNLGSCSSGNEDASMTELSAYVLERIREGQDFTLYHGSLSRVLAVALAAEHPSPHGFRRLEHEYSLAAEPLALTRHEGRTILILMDAGGEPLDLVLQRGQLLDLTCVLRIAIGLATALRQIHRRGLVHKEYAKTRTKKAHLGHDGCRCSGSPAAGA